MYISETCASGFRCFDLAAPLQLKLSSGLDFLVGPNEAGKSAIIDAARYVLWARGDDYIRPDEHDFHFGGDGTRGCDFIVRRTFDDLSADEEARFLEMRAGRSSSRRLGKRAKPSALSSSPTAVGLRGVPLSRRA